jgi:predicted TIM-barrel fold metal-dependent hydrolase
VEVFDAHVHVWQPELIPAGLRQAWARHAAYRSDPARDEAAILPRVSRHIADPEGRYVTAALRRAGIRRAVVVGVDFSVAGGSEAEIPLPDALKLLAGLHDPAGPELSFVAGVDPRRADAAAVLADALDRLGAVGLKLYPPAGFRPGDPRTLALCGLARERGLPVLVHTGTAPAGLDSRLGWPGHLTDVQSQFPDLRLVLCHAGFPAWFDDAVAYASTHPRTYLELSRWQKLAQDDWAGFRQRMASARSLVGSERIIFASDLACGEGNWERGSAALTRWADQIASLADGRPFGREEIELILHGNAERLFRPAA